MKHLRKIVLAVFLASSFSPQPAKAEPIIIGIITAVAAAIAGAIIYNEGEKDGENRAETKRKIDAQANKIDEQERELKRLEAEARANKNKELQETLEKLQQGVNEMRSAFEGLEKDLLAEKRIQWELWLMVIACITGIVTCLSGLGFIPKVSWWKRRKKTHDEK